jgi:hypothetical protein
MLNRRRRRRFVRLKSGLLSAWSRCGCLIIKLAIPSITPVLRYLLVLRGTGVLPYHRYRKMNTILGRLYLRLPRLLKDGNLCCSPLRQHPGTDIPLRTPPPPPQNLAHYHHHHQLRLVTNPLTTNRMYPSAAALALGIRCPPEAGSFLRFKALRPRTGTGFQ